MSGPSAHHASGRLEDLYTSRPPWDHADGIAGWPATCTRI
jgi:hypothetical protein